MRKLPRNFIVRYFISRMGGGYQNILFRFSQNTVERFDKALGW